MKHSKSVVIVAQIMISLSMALMMSALLGPIMHGFPQGWFRRWAKYFFIAWPTALLLASVIPAICFKLAAALVKSCSKSGKASGVVDTGRS